ncbi:drug metabolite transporter superfamily permease [Lasius niger]|uniref:Drug metabolite transporter superfamily permease n=1 Tax=Lasius niger TaxID=67767 RepID=A0A0J7JTL2_LASNI|nr:drug metabolite transporter superfamily permease [Lasius niger]
MFQMEQEVEVITIDDSEDDEVEMIEDDVVMEVNEVNEVMEVNEVNDVNQEEPWRISWRLRLEAWIQNAEAQGPVMEPIADSDYDSECDGIDYDVHEQIINTVDISAMDDDNRMCAIHIYYQPWGGDEQLCARCFLRRRDPYRRNPYAVIDVVRTHRTARLGLLLRQWCTECSIAMDQLFMRNMCPMCNPCKYTII